MRDILSFNKLRALTCGHKTFGVMWLFEHPATHLSLVTVDTNAARSPKRFIPQTMTVYKYQLLNDCIVVSWSVF